ncbi:MAG: tetratricopeptide repeat protein [Anaerolineaceae bacterium]|nr:tetratricopeptide repeat protein [Anaerolineaceae bacterium]
MMTANQKIFQDAMNEGHSAAWDQDWIKAAEFYKKALSQFPDNAKALSNLGLAFYELKEFENALMSYRKASKLAPADPIAQEKIARILERLGRLPEAVEASIKAADLHLKSKDIQKSIECWQRVISLKPDHLMARTRLAMIYERMGHKEEAVSEFLATASIMQKAGEIGRAMQVVDYCLKMLPEHVKARDYQKGLNNNQPLPQPRRYKGGTGPVRMSEVKRMDEPHETDANPQNPIFEARQRSLVKLASLLFDQAEAVESSDDIERKGFSQIANGHSSLNPSNSSKNTQIMLHLGQAIDSQTKGNDDQAVIELEKAVGFGLEHPAANYNLGLIMRKDNPRKALKQLQKSSLHPDFALGSFLLIGQILEEMDSIKEASRAYLQALSIADSKTVPEDLSHEVQQLYEPIIESQLNENDEESLRALCTTIANQLLRSDYRSFLNIARQQMPPHPEGSLPLPITEILLEIDSNQVIDSLGFVHKLVRAGKYHSAMEEIFRVLIYAPTYLPLHIQIGEILLKLGQTHEAITKFLVISDLYKIRGEIVQAIRVLTRVTSIEPMNRKVRRKLIELLVSQNQKDQAIQEYINLANIHYQLAQLKVAREIYQEALQYAQLARLDRTWKINILYKIADIDVQKLQWRQAIRLYEQIRTLEPGDAKARVKLVDLNFKLGQNDVAFLEIEKYIQFAESMGKRGNAIEFLNEVIIDHSEKVPLRTRLAELYIQNDQIKDAVEHLDVIADFQLSSGNQSAAIEILKQIIALNPSNVNEYIIALQNLN